MATIVYEISHGFLTHQDISLTSMKDYCSANNIDWSEITEKTVEDEVIEKIALIVDLLDTDFLYLKNNLSKIDFRKHLKRDIYLEKDVSMSLDGRPSIAIYTHNGQNVAKIRFQFSFDAYYFLSERKEFLSYYYSDGTLSEEIAISSEAYNALTSPYHMKKSQEERIMSRENIIQMLKGKIQIFILQAAAATSLETMMPIINSVSAFFKKYDSSYRTWLEAGAGDFIQVITDDVEFAFLDATVAPDITIRMYVIASLQQAT